MRSRSIAQRRYPPRGCWGMREHSVTDGAAIRWATISRLPPGPMLGRIFTRCVRRLLLVVPLLLAALPLAAPTLAAELVVDNAEGTVQIKGKWTSTKETPGFYGADYLFRTPGDGSSSVTWPFPAGGPAGQYTVFAQWSAGPNRATNATYQIASSAGASSAAVNQKTNGTNWQQLGAFDFQPNKSQGVTLTDKADGVVVADAIRFVGAPAGGLAATAVTPPPPAPASPPPQPSVGAAAPNDARFFAQTGYRIAEDGFWSYFQARGGV